MLSQSRRTSRLPRKAPLPIGTSYVAYKVTMYFIRVRKPSRARLSTILTVSYLSWALTLLLLFLRVGVVLAIGFDADTMPSANMRFEWETPKPF